MPTISKSRFVAGNQCPLRLWNQCFHPELATPLDTDAQARFETGIEMGTVARGRFPGVLVEADHQHPEDALAETARLLADPTVLAIHEAAFQCDGSLVRVDMLVRRNGAWDVIETKSVVEEKEAHLLDAAFQRWVVSNSGTKVGGTFLLRLDREYTYEGGALDLARLFLLEEVSEKVEGMAPQIEAELTELRDIIQKAHESPNVEPGRHCLEPHECSFLAHCTRDWPKVPDPVDWLPGVGDKKAMDLRVNGIFRMSELPRRDLKPNQLQVAACHRDNATWVGAGLKDALKEFKFPIHYLDFETAPSALPRLVGSHPYEQVPVQWSSHTEEEDGHLRHQEFLAEGDGDPRELFITSLLNALGTKGSICVYSSYEKTILKKLAQTLPNLAMSIEAVIGRLVDLLPIVKANVYHPGFQGSYSIKKVLPALVPGFDYSGLEVQDGLGAIAAFNKMISEPNPETRQALRRDLLVYCGQDTLAMVRVMGALRAFVL